MIPQGIILHCAATPDNDNSKFDIDDIEIWHKKRGFNGVGYHYVIPRHGLLQKGRKEHIYGAHAKGFNDYIGICLLGTRKFNRRQLTTLLNLLVELMEKYEWGPDNIHGHNEFSKKECPGFDVEILRSTLFFAF